jgi:hypothetical protein
MLYSHGGMQHRLHTLLPDVLVTLLLLLLLLCATACRPR